MSNNCNYHLFFSQCHCCFWVIGFNVKLWVFWLSHFHHFLRPPLKAAVDSVELRNILDRPYPHVLVLVGQVLPLQVGQRGWGGDCCWVGKGGGRGHTSSTMVMSTCTTMTPSSSSFSLLHAPVVGGGGVLQLVVAWRRGVVGSAPGGEGGLPIGLPAGSVGGRVGVVQRGEGLMVGGNVGLQWVVRVGGHRVVGRLEQSIGGKRVEGRGAIFVASGLKSST